MKFKDFAIKEQSEGGDGGFTGYAATFDREPDSYGDVIAPGAFTRTLEAWAESGKPIPLLYDHNMGDPDYNIGFAEVEQDDRGLLVNASFDGSPKAQRVRELVREGRLHKMSFAYDVRDEATVTLDGGVKANELRDLDLFEVSVVLVPANGHAEIIESKSSAKYGRTISKATGGTLEEALDALSEIADAADRAERAIRSLMDDEPEPEPEDETGDPADEGEAEEDPDEGNSADAKSSELIARLKRLINQ